MKTKKDELGRIWKGATVDISKVPSHNVAARKRKDKRKLLNRLHCTSIL
jgi:hypothetical protein